MKYLEPIGERPAEHRLPPQIAGASLKSVVADARAVLLARLPPQIAGASLKSYDGGEARMAARVSSPADCGGLIEVRSSVARAGG